MKKTYSALQIASYLVELSNRVDESDLTNLKLQKILYIAQGKYLAKKGKPLFENNIEAWDLGPVVREVYEAYKSCGPFPITVFDIDNQLMKIELPEDIKSFISDIWDEFGKYSANHLVKMTHQKGTPWNRYYVQGQNNIIPVNDLKEYFYKK